MINEDNVVYREIQSFRQIWLWALILGLTVVMWYGFFEQIVFSRSFGNRPVSNDVLIILWWLFGILFPWFFYKLRLVTLVKNDGIYVRFIPFQFSFCHFPIGELQQYEDRVYEPIREYGGWGLRCGGQGRAYNVSGNEGIQLVLTNGSRVLIGTQNSRAFLHAINQIVGQNKSD